MVSDAVTRLKFVELFRYRSPKIVLAPAPEPDASIDVRGAWDLTASALEMAAAPNVQSDSVALDAAPALAAYDSRWNAGFVPTEYVDVSSVVTVKHQALEAHETLAAWFQEHRGVALHGVAEVVQLRVQQARGRRARELDLDVVGVRADLDDATAEGREKGAECAALASEKKALQARLDAAIAAEKERTSTSSAKGPNQWNCPSRPRRSRTGSPSKSTPS